MQRQFGHERYWTTFVDDRHDGRAGLRLHRERFGKTVVAGQVFFWDASGQSTVQTLDGDVPVEILEEAIAEAKERIRLK